MNPTSYKEIQIQNPAVKPGGHWSPSDCSPLWKIAIIIPFRDRDSHLRIFLSNMLPFLQQQHIAYSVYVIEQVSLG
jgi:beta-1,4-galactosyltransferase 1